LNPLDWRMREFLRFVNGTYRHVPWVHEPWAADLLAVHFPHVSTGDPESIAFTASPEKGAADRQTTMRPGRYLARFFGDVLTPQAIQTWAERWNTLYSAECVHFATTPEDIVDVYENGPHSCMRGESCVSVYGAGDLAVAYLKSGDKVTARALCFPARNIFASVYGDSARLTPALEALGYSYSRNGRDWEGARLLLEENNGGYTCPYIDVSTKVSVRGNFLVMEQGGDWRADTTTGLVGADPCDRCGDSCDLDTACTVGGEVWCGECADAHGFYCEGCNETCPIADSATVDGESRCYSCAQEATRCDFCSNLSLNVSEYGSKDLCEYCANRHTSECFGCGESVLDDTLASVNISENASAGFCEECAAALETCSACEEKHSDDAKRPGGCAACQSAEALEAIGQGALPFSRTMPPWVNITPETARAYFASAAEGRPVRALAWPSEECSACDAHAAEIRAREARGDFRLDPASDAGILLSCATHCVRAATLRDSGVTCASL
jgi:hypothetical protein